MDLRATISAVSKLPFGSDRLVEILCSAEPGAADNPNDEEHTTFWLVVADQFAKRGIISDRVQQKALEIIDAESDIAMLETLGGGPADIGKRRKLLKELRARLTSATPGKPRTVIRKPQPLLMGFGDVIVYPTCGGKCINPYFASKELDRQYTKNGPQPWRQDGWAAAVIIDCGRAFEYLSWYRPLTIAMARPDKPELESLLGDELWRLQTPGTCSPTHFKRMELERIGNLPVDPEKVSRQFGKLRPGISAAVSNISLANHLSAAPSVKNWAIPKPGEGAKGRAPTILGVRSLLL